MPKVEIFIVEDYGFGEGNSIRLVTFDEQESIRNTPNIGEGCVTVCDVEVSEEVANALSRMQNQARTK